MYDEGLSAAAAYCSDLIAVKRSVIEQTVRANERILTLVKNDTAKLRREFLKAQDETHMVAAKEKYLKNNREEHDSHIKDLSNMTEVLRFVQKIIISHYSPSSLGFYK